MPETKYYLLDQHYYLAPRREGTYWERDWSQVIAESDSLENLARFRKPLGHPPDHDYFIKSRVGNAIETVEEFHRILRTL